MGRGLPGPALLVLAAWTGVFVLVAGCNSRDEWIVALKDGTTHRCRFLEDQAPYVRCVQNDGVRILEWSDVAGYRSRVVGPE